MTQEEVLKIVTLLVRNELDSTSFQNAVLPHHKLRDDLHMDSINLVGLSVALEDEFEMRFDPTTMDLVEIFDTVESLADFIYTRSAGYSNST